MAKFDITTLEIPAPVAKPLYAGVGATDLVVEYVRETVADVQKKFSGVQKNVKSIDVDTVTKEAKARRAAVEARVAALQNDAKTQADKVSKLVDENVATVTDAYTDLAKRGESLVTRIRKQESTKATVASAKTTAAKAKTTKTQAAKATTSTAKTTKTATKSAAKKSTTAAKKTSAPVKSSAKATTTTAATTATKAVDATTDAAAKVGN